MVKYDRWTWSISPRAWGVVLRTGMAVLLIALATSITIAIVAVAEEADAAMYDVDLSYKDASPIRVAQALNPVVFNFTLEHTGDTLSEEVKVELLNEPPLWQHVFRANTRTGFVISTSTLEVLLQRGEIASLTLTVTVPLNQLNQTYWMTVKTYPKKDTSRSETFIIGVIVPQVADFALELWDPPVDDTYTGIGPTSVTIQLALYNSGNGADHFLIEGNSSLAGEGWLLTFESGIDEFGFTPNITPDPAKRTPYFIVVHVDIPADALGGIMSMVSFEVTSMFNPSVMRTQVLAAVKSLQFAGFEIEVWNIPPDGVYRAIPPSVVTIRFALYNTGNGGDRFLIQAECSRSDEGWKLTFVQGVDEYGFTPNLTADPNKRSPHFIDVKVNIPANTRAGVTAQIVINATSMFNLSKQMPPAFAQVEALQYYNFDAFIEGVDSKEGIPGETVTFQARIWNKGNGWDEFHRLDRPPQHGHRG